MAAKDNNRDARFILLRDFISGWAKIEDDKEKSSSAKLLLAIFEEIGMTLYTLGYANETAYMNALISRLEEQDAQGALAVLGAGEMFESIKIAQAEFEKLYEDKVAKEADQDYPLLRESKTRLARYLKLLLLNLNFLSEQDPDTYKDLVEEINMVITSLNATAKARETREENGANSVQDESGGSDESQSVQE